MRSKAKIIWEEISVYLYISLGLIIYGTGVTLFMIPYQITSGGVTGISSLIFYATGTIEVQVSYLTINAFLLVAAVKILGWKFCVKTIYGVLFLTFYMWVIQRVVEDPVTGDLPRLVKDQTFMAVVLGAVLEGIGLSICFSHNGSTGGTDIIAAIVNKYKDISFGQGIMLCDCIIISSSYFVYEHKYGPDEAWQMIVFGFTTFIIAGVTLDYALNRTRQAVEFKIFSRNYARIADAISNAGFGVTVLDGNGWYTHSERKVLICICSRRYSPIIMRAIKTVDPYAFVSVANVESVYGEGFSIMKAKLKNQKPILVFATNNAHKLEEVRTIIGNKFEIRSLEDINCKVELPETSDTLEGNALQKAQYVKKFYGFDCFADDTGLECEALNGEPGVMTARYAGGAGHDDKANIQKLLTNLQDKENRKAQFRTSIALIYKGQTYSFEGIVKGTIAEEKRGEAGFGYDPVFIPEGYTDTFAQLGGDIKNTISHRAKAVSQLCDFLVHSEQEKRRRLVNHKSK